MNSNYLDYNGTITFECDENKIVNYVIFTSKEMKNLSCDEINIKLGTLYGEFIKETTNSKYRDRKQYWYLIDGGILLVAEFNSNNEFLGFIEED